MKELIFYVLGEINHLAVLLAALANFFVGALWYSPLMFAKSWSRLNFGDVDMEEMKKKVNVGFVMGMAFITTWLMAYFLSVPIVIIECMQMDLKYVLLFTIFITGAFMVVNMYKHYLFEMKSFRLLLINAAHDIIVMAVMAIIITMMQDPDIDKLKAIFESMVK